MNLQKAAPEDFQKHMFQEFKELEHQKTPSQGSEVLDTMSFESCASSIACDLEEVSLEAPKKIDMEEVMSEASGTAVTRGKGKEGWNLEPEREAEKSEGTAVWSEERASPRIWKVKAAKVLQEQERQERNGNSIQNRGAGERQDASRRRCRDSQSEKKNYSGRV